MKKWIGGLLATIISGVVIYWLTVGWPGKKEQNSKSDSSKSSPVSPSGPNTDSTKTSVSPGRVVVGPPPSVAHVPTGVVVPPPPGIYMSPLEFNTNRPGSDIRNFLVRTAEECSRACLSERTCRAMTFVASAQGGVCWLKNAAPTGTAGLGMTSAVKRF